VTSAADATIGRVRWLFRQTRKKIWVRASFFSLAGVAVALLSAVADQYIPYDPTLTLAAGSVGSILNIIAASMLAVTTFSLSIMISAYASATQNGTPRATMLLVADPVAQNALATFIGSFLFSIVGIVGLAAGVYSSNGRVILFASTLVVLFFITATLLRWINQLSSFGRVGDTIDRVEAVATKMLVSAAAHPRSGAQKWIEPPADAWSVMPSEAGIVQHIDMAALNELCGHAECKIWIATPVGSLAYPGKVLFQVDAKIDGIDQAALRNCVTIADHRQFDNDPRFGLIALSEIASRALSPAVNDPGTAIATLHSALRTLLAYGGTPVDQEGYNCLHIYAADLDIAGLFEIYFAPIIRDGAGMAEVQIKLVDVLLALARGYPKIYDRPVQQIIARMEEMLVGSKIPSFDKNVITSRIATISD
jgi:uncharacterized membrane protein